MPKPQAVAPRDNNYDLAAGLAEQYMPVRAPVGQPKPTVPGGDGAEKAAARGIVLSKTLLAGAAVGIVGAGVGVALLVGLMALMTASKSGNSESTPTLAAAPEAKPKATEATPPEAPKPPPASAEAPLAPHGAPNTPQVQNPPQSPPPVGSEPAEPAPTAPPPAPAVAAAPTPAPNPPSSAGGAAAPADDPGMVSAAAAAGLIEDAPPEPAVDSELAKEARAAAAAAVANLDDSSGKTLSTADIVAESEPAVALIKGNGSSGTAFLVGPRLIATNSHVIDDEFVPDLDIRFVSADEKHKAPIKAELLYEDAERDLAFLAVKTDLKPLRIAKSYNFRKGEDVTVIGNPGVGAGEVLENAISRGVMSTKVKIDNKDFYQLSIAINPGNSGGPVFDSAGRVIGVATLKSVKQEAMGFSIPIEDLQAGLAKMAKQSSADANQYRSRHRIRNAVKGLGSSGALLCMIIDLRRAASGNPQAKDLLDKLEPVAAEMNKELFPSLTAHSGHIKSDSLIASSIKKKVSDMNENFSRIKGAFSGKNVDDNQLRQWKQTHKRLITELSPALKLEIPEGIMVAFEDHAPSQSMTIIIGPSNLGSFGPRLRPPTLTRPPGSLPRSPSLRDRMGPRRGIR
jgi:S1-C subfamily serine protease